MKIEVRVSLLRDLLGFILGVVVGFLGCLLSFVFSFVLSFPVSSTSALSIFSFPVGSAMSTSDEFGEDVLDLGNVEGSIRENSGSFCLAGKLCTDRSYNTYALMDVMIKAFKCRTKADVREWGNKLLIFTFLDEIDREWVIRNQPWHFDGHLFVVKSLDGSEQPSGVSITRASFWTRVTTFP
ncbi:hypothetical protein ACS0TY_016601 [Phlomoides rotata]